jgi:hypothetical protein
MLLPMHVPCKSYKHVGVTLHTLSLERSALRMRKKMDASLGRDSVGKIMQKETTNVGLEPTTLASHRIGGLRATICRMLEFVSRNEHE